MPTIKLTTSVVLEREAKKTLSIELAKAVAETLGKPLAVTQAIVQDDEVISFGGNFDSDSAFIVVLSIGALNQTNCNALSARLCDLMKQYGVDPKFTYICFNDKRAEEWGCNSKTLA